MIVSYYSIFLQKSILWLRCMYYSDESSRVKQGRGEGCVKSNIGNSREERKVTVCGYGDE